MKYQGSKRRLATKLLPIILEHRTKEQWYIEPFVGGANMIERVTGNKIGADINEYIIMFWKSLQVGWTPEYITRELYYRIKQFPDKYPKCIVAHAAINCSYRGKWFGGYAKQTMEGDKLRDYIDESLRHIARQAPKLKDVKFIHASYQDLQIPANSIIYCDPPYEATLGYKDTFDSDAFWEWCRLQSIAGHSVFVSEYTAPSDFTEVYSATIRSSIDHSKPKVATEKLFTI